MAQNKPTDLRLWSLPLIGNRIRKWTIRREGGERTSTTLRAYARLHRKVDVGLYTYGGCFWELFNSNVWDTVTVGRYCSIASCVICFRADHPMENASMTPYFYTPELGGGAVVTGLDTAPLVIGHDVWIGYGAIITRGCTSIGNGAVIGAGSVVTHDVPPYAIVSGTPARLMRYRFREDEIEALERSRWWELDPQTLLHFYAWVKEPREWAERIIACRAAGGKPQKIGIVTFNDAYDYGAFFQQYALQQFLQHRGYDVDILAYQNEQMLQQYRDEYNLFRRKGLRGKLVILHDFVCCHRMFRDRMGRKKKFRACIQRELQMSEPFTRAQAPAVAEQYACLVAGSDQVWNRQLTGGEDFYFLDFVDDPWKKKSYAASFGTAQCREEDRAVIAEKLRDFSSLLVREDSGKDLLEQLGMSAQVVLDPVFLIDREQWVRLAGRAAQPLPERFVFIYSTMGKPDRLLTAAKTWADDHGCQVVLIFSGAREIGTGGMRTTIDAGPYEFLQYMCSAEAVFTNSFHGLALSICLGKEFYYELDHAPGNKNTRLESTARLFGLEDREITADVLPAGSIQWEKVNLRLEELRERSRTLLLESLPHDT